MKTIKYELPVGKSNQGLDLYVNIAVDGKPIKRMKCESFVGHFLNEIYKKCHGGRVEASTYGAAHYRLDATTNQDYAYRFSAIGSISDTTPVRVTGSSTSSSYWPFSNTEEGDMVIIYGARGTNLNGVYRYEKVGNYTADLYHMDGTPVAPDGQYSGGGYMNSFGMRSMRMTDSVACTMTAWEPIVGLATAPVKASDRYLGNRIPDGSGKGQLSHTTTNVSTQVTDKPTSRFTLTRSFTNATDSDISVNEIGIQSCYRTDSDKVTGLLARDVLDSTITIAPGRTMSLDYEVIIELTPDTQDTDLEGTNGGFLARFMNRLRVLATYTGLSANEWFFGMGWGSGTMNPTYTDGFQAWQFGIRVGTDNEYVSMTNESLIAQIDHGEQDGQLYYYGTNVEKFIEDDVANEASFVVSRIFQNRGATPVTIAEIGLYGNNSSSSTGYQYPSPWLYARHALHPDDQHTIAAGEFVKIDYVIKAVV